MANERFMRHYYGASGYVPPKEPPMADQVLTVEQARADVLHEALEYVDSRETFQQKVDALIAAVRADEHAQVERLTMIANEWQKRARAAEAILTANGIESS